MTIDEAIARVRCGGGGGDRPDQVLANEVERLRAANRDLFLAARSGQVDMLAKIDRLREIMRRLVEADKTIVSMGVPGVYRRHMQPIIHDAAQAAGE